MIVMLARPRGFCDGVVRAVEAVEEELLVHGAPVYVLHEIVHNRHVVERLRERGAIFVESIDEIAPGQAVVFSAHGVPRSVVRMAEEKNLRAVDATCRLVKKVHFRARRYSREGREIIIIGHEGHPEVEGTKGWIDGAWQVVSTSEEAEHLVVNDPEAVAYVTQTTLSTNDTWDIIAALKKRFPRIAGPGVGDICYATQSRQEAVHHLAGRIDLLLVVGSRTSSNSNRLREVGERSGCRSHLIEDARDIDPSWVRNVWKIGVTAGASAPEVLVQGVVKQLQKLGATEVVEMNEASGTPFTYAPYTDLSQSNLNADFQ